VTGVAELSLSIAVANLCNDDDDDSDSDDDCHSFAAVPFNIGSQFICLQSLS